MTAIGLLRIAYAEKVESRPSRFTDPAAYTAWAARADAWGLAKVSP